MTDLDKIMTEILGKDAYFSTDFKVTDSVRVLAKTVRYLFTQIEQCKQYMEDDDMEYVDEIKQKAIDILKNE